MVLITQLAGIVESRVASIPSGDGSDASIAALRYGWLIFMLPHSVITVSVATAYFTRMSGHARDGDLASLRTDVSAALRGILLIMVFAFVALVVLAWPFAAVFAQTPTQVAALATVLLAFLVGLIPFTVLFVLQRVFYSLDDTRTPFFVQVVQAVLYVVGALLVAAFAPDEWIAVGLALVLSIAGTVQTITAAVLLRRRLQGLALGRVALRALWFLAAAVVAGAAGCGRARAARRHRGCRVPGLGSRRGDRLHGRRRHRHGGRLPRRALDHPQSRTPRLRHAASSEAPPPVAPGRRGWPE